MPKPSIRGAQWILFPILGVSLAALGVAHGQGSAYRSLPQVRAAIADAKTESITVGGATLTVAFADGASGLDRKPVLQWIRSSAETVAAYFGTFPVKNATILVVAQSGSRVGHATTWGFGGSTIRIGVGRGANSATYARDWVMVHELAHLGLPKLPEHQFWALEGSATYIEPIARSEAGDVSPEAVWSGMMQGLPNGLPRAGDRGLDRTPSWGRTYWGGALFYLLADIRIRQETDNRKGLPDAFRAINRTSGGNIAAWRMDRLAAVGDRGTGTHVLTELYQEMKDTPVPVDLDTLFADLGVVQRGDTVIFDDDAPLADIRRAIIAPPS